MKPNNNLSVKTQSEWSNSVKAFGNKIETAVDPIELDEIMKEYGFTKIITNEQK